MHGAPIKGVQCQALPRPGAIIEGVGHEGLAKHPACDGHQRGVR
jgi:hypothetical protein